MAHLIGWAAIMFFSLISSSSQHLSFLISFFAALRVTRVVVTASIYSSCSAFFFRTQVWHLRLPCLHLSWA